LFIAESMSVDRYVGHCKSYTLLSQYNFMLYQKDSEKGESKNPKNEKRQIKEDKSKTTVLEAK